VDYSNREELPYRAYMHALESVFDFSIVDNFSDVCCSSGWLLYSLKKKYPKINVLGLDYFEWAKQYSHESVRGDIELVDLSKKYENLQTFSIVNCTEVGEHIEPECEGVFIDNLVNMSGDILILGWSNDKVDGCHQHLNPKPRRYIRNQLEKKGFQEWTEISNVLRNTLREECKNGAYEWWWGSLTVYKKRTYKLNHSKRLIQGCANDNDLSGMRSKYSGLPLQSQLLKLRDEINVAVLNKNPLSILRFSDGDLYYSHALPVGSAKPGSRALTVDYCHKNDLSVSRQSIYKVDYVVTEIGSMSRGGLYLTMILELFYKVFPNYNKLKISREWRYNRWFYHFIRKFSGIFNLRILRILLWPVLSVLAFRLKINRAHFPLLLPFPYAFEVIYGLVSSRLIFKMFPMEIMLVGQLEKIKAIKILMNNEEYRNYLGVSSFCSYVGVKAIGAADNHELILKEIKEQCALYQPKVILIGIGSAKLYVLPKIKGFSNAVVIDVGAGIDALAGVVSQDRPYFANWINFKSSKINYLSMDMMDQDNPNRDSDKYGKIVLD